MIQQKSYGIATNMLFILTYL